VAYDQDGIYPAFGFGGINPATMSVSHCFALNGDESSPGVQGVRGVLDAYQLALTQWGLSGPTNFAPVIRAAAAKCRAQV